tara:strand:+ start:1977 stop:2588 length:612 start_codon:yes stop_codon:yes gene_type:complete
MPRLLENQAKHKQMIDALHKFQEKLDGLAVDDLINSEAYRQLCNGNKDLFEEFKSIFDEIMVMKLMYQQNILGNVWVQQYNNANYHQRQVKTREYKMNCPGYKRCECGDWISMYRKDKDKKRPTEKMFITHQKTEKCMSNRARLKWEAQKKVKLSKVVKIDTYLLLNSHINHKANDSEKHVEQERLVTLAELVRRRRHRKMSL